MEGEHIWRKDDDLASNMLTMKYPRDIEWRCPIGSQICRFEAQQTGVGLSHEYTTDCNWNYKCVCQEKGRVENEKRV